MDSAVCDLSFSTPPSPVLINKFVKKGISVFCSLLDLYSLFLSLLFNQDRCKIVYKNVLFRLTKLVMLCLLRHTFKMVASPSLVKPLSSRSIDSIQTLC